MQTLLFVMRLRSIRTASRRVGDETAKLRLGITILLPGLCSAAR